MTTDARGGIWIAHWDGGRISRFHADGRLDRVVALPTTLITSCAFGGPDLRTLFVTSAMAGNDDGLGGSLFAMEVEVAGSPAWLYEG